MEPLLLLPLVTSSTAVSRSCNDLYLLISLSTNLGLTLSKDFNDSFTLCESSGNRMFLVFTSPSIHLVYRFFGLGSASRTSLYSSSSEVFNILDMVVSCLRWYSKCELFSISSLDSFISYPLTVVYP